MANGTEGTTYIVRRKRPGESEFAIVALTGAKRFVDDTLDSDVAGVQYTVQGHRASAAGPLSETLTVLGGRQQVRGRVAQTEAVARANHRSSTSIQNAELFEPKRVNRLRNAL